MNRSAGARTATVIDVGPPPRPSSGWEALEFRFHRFERLPAEPGRFVRTSRVERLGHTWWMKLYPAGRGGGDGVNDGAISVTLCKSKNSPGEAVEYEINILDEEGDRVCTVHSSAGEDDGRNSACMERRYLVDPPNGVLADGALIVQLRLKPAGGGGGNAHELFIPNNSASRKMESLLRDGGERADVTFEFPGKDRVVSDACHPPRHRAHYAVLAACAPGLAALCEPCLETGDPVPIVGVTSGVFGLLLRHVYGLRISIDDWRAHALDLIDAADRYDVPDLKLTAEARYVESVNVTANNAVDMLLYADAMNCALLKEHAMDYFVQNGSVALRQVSFDEMPASRGLFADLLRAIALNDTERGGEGVNGKDCRSMCVSRLRSELDRMGLDVDGSRETLVKRLEGARASRPKVEQTPRETTAQETVDGMAAFALQFVQQFEGVRGREDNASDDAHPYRAEHDDDSVEWNFSVGGGGASVASFVSEVTDDSRVRVGARFWA